MEPFQRLIAAGMADTVMAGHVVNGQLDPDHPASLSRAVVGGVLRGELGWNGPVVTDDLQAAAIDEAFGFDEAVLLALEAGNDLLLFANQQSLRPRDRDPGHGGRRSRGSCWAAGRGPYRRGAWARRGSVRPRCWLASSRSGRHDVATSPAGVMFWFSRKRFVGS